MWQVSVSTIALTPPQNVTHFGELLGLMCAPFEYVIVSA